MKHSLLYKQYKNNIKSYQIISLKWLLLLIYSIFLTKQRHIYYLFCLYHLNSMFKLLVYFNSLAVFLCFLLHICMHICTQTHSHIQYICYLQLLFCTICLLNSSKFITKPWRFISEIFLIFRIAILALN